jgi:hypothetical protein
MSSGLGAFCFGAVIGWFTYFVNRYRAEIKLADVASILGAIGGAAVLKLFPSGTTLFAAYGVGLAVGFFAYFLILVLFVGGTSFTFAWFLDGRRPKYGKNEMGPTESPSRGMFAETEESEDEREDR